MLAAQLRNRRCANHAPDWGKRRAATVSEGLVRIFLMAGMALALAGCVETTRFKDADGRDIYLADCEADLHLQSCRAALDSTCPNGYDVIRPVMRRQGEELVATKSGYFRCR